MSRTESLVILVPYFEDKGAFLKLIFKLNEVLSDYFLVIVDDGSLTENLTVSILANANSRGTLISLKRNIGMERAIATGLTYISKHIESDRILIMDSDGEDSPESIPLLLEYRDRNLESDVIVASRLSRKNSFKFKMLYSCYKLLFRLTTGKQMNYGHFSLISRKVVLRIINYSELWIHLGSTYTISKFKISTIKLSRGIKYDDKPARGHLSLITHGLKSIIVLSELIISRLFVFSLTAITIIVIFTVYSLIGGGGLYLGIIAILLVLLNLTIIVLFLGTARNSGEYNSSNYDQLIESVFDF